MSLPSWKSYGGTGSMEKTNNISVNSLSANYLTLKNAYIGYFSISGELSVSGATILQSNVLIGGNCITTNDAITGENHYIKGYLQVIGNAFIGNNVEVGGNTLVKGNLVVLQNYEIDKNLKVNGNIIQLGLSDRLNELYNINLYANKRCLGYNKEDPSYTIDIVSTQENGFQIKSTLSKNTNIISQNGIGQKISAISGLSESVLTFSDIITNTKTPSASIKYSYDGNLLLDVETNTIIKSKLTVNNNNNVKSSHTFLDESVLIYDVSNGIFLPDVYNINEITSGNALSLVSENELSNTGMNIITPLGKGIKVLGGVNAIDSSKSMGIIGIYDKVNNMIPCETILCGNTVSKIRSTIGINTLFPESDNYVFDVNGPVKINHREINIVKSPDFIIYRILFYENDRRYGIAFGSSIKTIDKRYEQKILYTIDKGETWNESIFYEGSESISSLKLVCGCVYNSSVGVIGGDSGILLFSIDGFKTWHRINGMSEITTTITSLILLDQPNGEIVICFSYLKDTKKTLGFFLVKNITSFSVSTSNFVINQSISSRDDLSVFYENKPPLTILLNSITKINAIKRIKSSTSSIIKSILVVGEGGIGRLNVNNDFTRSTLSSSSTMLFTDITMSNKSYFYNDVDSYENICIAIGKGIISTSFDDGFVWQNIEFDSTFFFNDIYINNYNNAIVVGDNGKILVSIDNGVNWSTIDTYLSSSKIITFDCNLLSVFMVDDNTFLISLKPLLFDSSQLISCYFPDLFNHSNNTVMDIYGNMKLYGDIHVYDNVYVSKNMNITKECNVIGNTLVSCDLFVGKDTIVQGNSTIIGNVLAKKGLLSGYLDSLNTIDNTILIGTRYQGGTTIKLSDDTMINSNNIFIGGIKDDITIKGNSVSCLSNLSLTYINDVNNEILIGTKNGGGKTIRISGGTDGSGSTSSNPNSIYIGGVDDNVIIKGNNVQIVGTISTAQSQIQLNSGSIGYNSSGGSGINIRDNENDASGYVRLNSKLDGYLFKSSDKYPNILNVRVNDLSIKNKYDTNLQPINNGLVILKNSSSVYGEEWDSNICTMTTASFDVNNIILGNSLHKEVSSSSQQTISSDFGIQGNTILYNKADSYSIGSGSFQVRGGVSIIGNTYVGGNLIIYKSTVFNGNVKMSSLLTNDGDTILNGNVSLKNATSLIGNVVLSGSYNKFNGTTDFSGNVLITNNIESYDISSGGMVVNGGIGISGNLSIGKDCNIIGNTVLRSNVTITNTSDSSSTGGSLLLKGGSCIEKSLYVKGNITIGNTLLLSNTLNVTNLGDGSLVTLGGGSIQKSLYVGDNEIIGLNNIIQIIPLDVVFTTTSEQIVTASSVNYKNGLYSITASSINSNYYDTFNESGVNYWNTSLGQRNAPTTICDNNVSIIGEYIQIGLPYAIIVTCYQLRGATTNYPTEWYFCGSKDGVSFSVLDYQVSIALSMSSVSSFPIESNIINLSSYPIFRVIVKSVVTLGETFSLKSFFLKGYPLISSKASLLNIGNATFVGNIISSGIIENLSSIDSTSIGSGALIVKGGVGIQGNSYLNATNVMGNLFVNKYVRIGNSSSSSSSSSSSNYALDVNGSMNVSGQFSLGNLILTDSTDSYRLGTGSLIVNGGVSISGNTYFGGNIICGNIVGGNMISGNMNVSGTITSNNMTANIVTISATGSIQCNGDIVCHGKFINDTFAVTSTSESYSSLTGAFVVPGGVGIGGNINIGKNIYANNIIIGVSQLINGSSIIKGDETINGNVYIKNTTDASELNTGSLQIKGGTSIIGNVITGGNIILHNQLLLLSKLDSTSIGSGSMIVSGGSSISGNCHIGGNTIIYGSYGGNSLLGITFPSTTTPVSDLFVTNTTNTNTISITEVSTNIRSSTISSQTGISSYKNGYYYFSTGKVQYSNYYGYNALISSSSNIPWISSYTYNNSNGNPIDNPVITTLYSDTDGNKYTIIGDWLQYGLPYQMILSNYSIKFANDLSITTLETTPCNWYLVGSIDNITWFLIHNVNNNLTTNDLSIDISETRPFSYYRYIITNVRLTTSTSGVQVPGIFNITYSGLPYLSPLPSTTTTSTTSTTSTTTTNTNQEIILPTSINTNSFIGTNTFAGSSTLINFGDSTTYGNYNLFRNLNIFGNITTARDDYNINMYSNAIIYGNVDIKQNSYTRGESILYGDTYMKQMVYIDQSLTVGGNITVSDASILSGKVTIIGNLLVNSSSSFANNVTVTGVTTLNGNMIVKAGSSTTLGGNVTVSGITSLNGNTVISGSSTAIGGNVTVSGITSLNGNTIISGSSTTIGGNVSVSGMTTLNGNMIVAGSSTTLGGNVTVSGITALNGNTVISGSSTAIGGNVTVSGITSLNGNTIISGSSTTIGGNVTVSGITTLNGNMVVSGSSMTLTGNLTVSGVSTIIKNVNVSGSTVLDNSVTCNSLFPIISNATNNNIYLSDKSLITKSFADSLLSNEVSQRNTAISSSVSNYLPLIGGTITGSYLTINTLMTTTGLIVMNNTTDVSNDTSGSLIVSGGALFKKDMNISRTVRVGYAGNSIYNILLNQTGVINAVSFNATSDYRIKENITNLDDNFTVDLLRPVSYVNKKTGKKDIGLIAHELEDHYSYLVNGRKDGDEYQSINYIGLIGILINEIQVLKQKVNNVMMLLRT